MRTFLDFFAGSGLVTEALRDSFTAVWANDLSPKKAAVYCANHGSAYFQLGPIERVRGCDLPAADLAWASFPCQDLSLAGPQAGIRGHRSGLVWEWLRVIRELPQRPRLLVAENVAGLVSSGGGQAYRVLHQALCELGYKTGAVLLDAVHWTPQSRPRIFVVAVPRETELGALADDQPGWAHSVAVCAAAEGLPDWVWWRLPKPPERTASLADIIDLSAPCHDEAASGYNLNLIAPQHRARLAAELVNGFVVAPGYKRTRNGRQVLELRFDGVAGCLRTPEGGSSRQLLVIRQNGKLATRLLTVREAARLMGVRDTYQIPGRYNAGYQAMGDAVAVPAVRFLARSLLSKLAAL